MRKSIILVIALFVYGALVGEGWAAKVSIGGTHSRSQIQATCGAVGGDFFSIEGGNYGCTKQCAGGTDTCAVECTNNGKCTGSCLSCGRVASPNRTPLPRLAGGDAVTRVLKNSVRRTKRY